MIRQTDKKKNKEMIRQTDNMTNRKKDQHKKDKKRDD